MGKETAISWCTATWNPWRGCTPISPACLNCYAAVRAERFPKQYPEGFGKLVRSKTTFNDPLKWEDPRRIFVCSLSDFLHPHADHWRDDAFDVMRKADHHTYLILTKRPERLHGYTWGDAWLGVTGENQEQLDKRANELTRAPLTRGKLFVSIEPMLESVGLRQWFYEPTGKFRTYKGRRQLQLRCNPRIDWVIVGGESGPNRREMKLEWLESVVEQCRDANVPVFVKQGSHRFPGQQGDIPDHLWKIKEFPHQNEVR